MRTVRLQWVVPNVHVHVTAICIVLLVLFLCKKAAFGQKHTEIVRKQVQWHPATATWYGSANGDGSDGGTCGYAGLVDQKPLRARVGTVSPVLFKGEEGCGACYKVRCMEKGLCSRKPVIIVVTDECPGGYCAFGKTHFDLSGAAFGRMATHGKTPALLNTGELSVLYRSTLCRYPGKTITFHVNQGSTVYWFSVLIEYEAGYGDVGAVQLKHGGLWCVDGNEAYLGRQLVSVGRSIESAIFSANHNVDVETNVVLDKRDSQEVVSTPVTASISTISSINQ